ncbi:hypothetical protein [Nocardiopsis sp. HUAS JQ3]|uniref:hypothetical protein n=1 Tax=Nocardiopsis sp. HUAS JQ3 TaxID=3061629 RepID=UPI0023A9CE2A|nr:hypothetical protein [Nocardiopsis sp. HUAS JQ3]WDZ88843.1 hypothetical protein PV789_17945 [Nocardiopsis sp. HUAS JQ3]
MTTEPEPVSTYLLILSEREAVAWVLRTSRMAFPATRRAEVERLKVAGTPEDLVPEYVEKVRRWRWR